jgi:hypothetical protein
MVGFEKYCFLKASPRKEEANVSLRKDCLPAV